VQVSEQEGNMSAKQENALTVNLIGNMPLPTLNVMVGSFTTENHQPPQGEVMKLTLCKLAENQPEPEKAAAPPPFGTHIREGVAVVKDWLKKP
jgi:hypothetical protein